MSGWRLAESCPSWLGGCIPVEVSLCSSLYHYGGIDNMNDYLMNYRSILKYRCIIWSRTKV